MRFEPDSGRKQDRLAVMAGGGVRFGIGQLQAEIFAEQLGFRLDPQRLLSGDSLTGGSSVRQKNRLRRRHHHPDLQCTGCRCQSYKNRVFCKYRVYIIPEEHYTYRFP